LEFSLRFLAPENYMVPGLSYGIVYEILDLVIFCRTLDCDRRTHDGSKV